MNNKLLDKRIELSRRIAVVLIMALTPPFSPIFAADSRPTIMDGYRVLQKISVARTIGGVDGFVQALQDERITGDLREKLKGMDSAMFCSLEAGHPVCRSIHQKPLRPMGVQLTDLRGRVLDSRTFARELGWIEARELYGISRGTFSMAIEFGKGMGS